MPDSPHESHIRSSIVAGSVYYYHENTISSPLWHYFIVINIDPVNDRVLLLVSSTTKINKIKQLRLKQQNCHPKTLVEISPDQYSGFTEHSLIDCNQVFPRTISELANMLAKRKLQQKPIMHLQLVKQLREGVKTSRLVAEEDKMLLDDCPVVRLVQAILYQGH
ncbi:MAG: hypothetical protein ABSA18_13390 [Dehalococcoidia bacterium]